MTIITDIFYQVRINWTHIAMRLQNGEPGMHVIVTSIEGFEKIWRARLAAWYLQSAWHTLKTQRAELHDSTVN